MKFEQAVSLKPTDHSACYHLGRLCLLLGDLATAEKWLKIAASHKPTHSPTLLCLGKCLVPSSTAHAKALIAYGLGVYIKTRDDISVGKKCANLQSLHGNEFWRPTNTLIVRTVARIIILNMVLSVFSNRVNHLLILVILEDIHSLIHPPVTKWRPLYSR